MITLLLLDLAGVEPADIASDYELSADRLGPLFATLGMADQGPAIRELLLRENSSVRAAVLATLEALDADAYLRAAGLGADDLAAVRARLLTS
ncbi:tyrosine-protein phosphatase [Streptosporangium sp. CA-115845]|uniref:tyrosine-protein phosphatase n=1 Tax=Streptosporangium sp. CA-115845 TaxID=3240071 RepID=UPI003D8D572D